jgi:hypothetical protein
MPVIRGNFLNKKYQSKCKQKGGGSKGNRTEITNEAKFENL